MHEQILQKLDDYDKRNVVSHNTRKRTLVSTIHSSEDFFRKNGAPFLLALIDEIEAAFDMSCIAPVQSLLVLDPSSIPGETSLIDFGEDDMKTIHDFYGHAQTDTYEGHTVTSNPIIHCSLETLILEYSSYKTYIATQKVIHHDKLIKEEKALQSSIRHAESQSYVSQRTLKALESELKSVQERIAFPIKAIDLLDDQVVADAFPHVRRLLVLYVLVPQSEAVVERLFSKMKLIMTDRRTSLDPVSLEALLRIAHNSNSLTPHDVNMVTEIWKKGHNRRIFSPNF